MAKKTTYEDFEVTVKAILDDYGTEVSEMIDQEVEEAAKLCVKEISSRAPTRYGNYAKSFKVLKKERSWSGSSRIVGAGKPYYRLTHLLEHGHYKVLWGHDTGGEVQGFPHIGPAEALVSQEFVDRVKRRLANDA